MICDPCYSPAWPPQSSLAPVLLYLPCYSTGEVTAERRKDQLPALHYAAHLGDLTAVLRLLQAGANAELADSSGVLTARHHAVLGGHGQLAKLLSILQNDEVTDLASAFAQACRNGETTIAEILLERGFVDTAVNPGENSGLGEAIIENHLETVCNLLKFNIKWPELSNYKGLMLAACSGSSALFDVMLEQARTLGAKDPGIQDEDGRTALHWAVLGGSRSMVEKLLNTGISPDITNLAGNTALHMACMEGHDKLIHPLSVAMDHPEAVNKDGFSILIVAALHGNAAICRQILQWKLVDPNIQDRTGNTALHRLAGSADAADIEVFCEYSANPDLSNDRGETVLIRCIRLGNLEAAQSLLAQGVDVNAVNELGQSALHLLSKHHLDALVEPLVDAGADIDARDCQGNTPLIQAVLDNSLHTVLAFADELATVDLNNMAGKSALDLARDLGHADIEQLLGKCLVEQQEVD